MAKIHFWEKPGCKTNARQKAVVAAAGHELIVHDLLREAWTTQRLLDFFVDLPVQQWFNMNAPRVKSGDLVPGMFDSNAALKAMIADPLLIRRPLIAIGSERFAGFDSPRLAALLGTAMASANERCSGHGDPCAGVDM